MLRMAQMFSFVDAMCAGGAPAWMSAFRALVMYFSAAFGLLILQSNGEVNRDALTSYNNRPDCYK